MVRFRSRWNGQLGGALQLTKTHHHHRRFPLFGLSGLAAERRAPMQMSICLSKTMVRSESRYHQRCCRRLVAILAAAAQHCNPLETFGYLGKLGQFLKCQVLFNVLPYHEQSGVGGCHGGAGPVFALCVLIEGKRKRRSCSQKDTAVPT